MNSFFEIIGKIFDAILEIIVFLLRLAFGLLILMVIIMYTPLLFVLGGLFEVFKGSLWMCLSVGTFILVYWVPYKVTLAVIDKKYKSRALFWTMTIMSLVLIPLCKYGIPQSCFLFYGKVLGVSENLEPLTRIVLPYTY